MTRKLDKAYLIGIAVAGVALATFVGGIILVIVLSASSSATPAQRTLVSEAKAETTQPALRPPATKQKTEIDEQFLRKLVTDKRTKAEVIQMIGKPNDTSTPADGGFQVAEYWWYYDRFTNRTTGKPFALVIIWIDFNGKAFKVEFP